MLDAKTNRNEPRDTTSSVASWQLGLLTGVTVDR
jgi:hypothetical protein